MLDFLAMNFSRVFLSYKSKLCDSRGTSGVTFVQSLIYKPALQVLDMVSMGSFPPLCVAGCTPRKCGRGVTDAVITRAEAERIRR